MESNKESLVTLAETATEPNYGETFAAPVHPLSMLMFEDYSEQFSDTCPEFKTWENIQQATWNSLIPDQLEKGGISGKKSPHKLLMGMCSRTTVRWLRHSPASRM